MSTYFLLDPFEFSYYFYRILGELIYVLSIVACIPSTFCPTLGHHQGRIYYKSDVTFVLAYYYCVRAFCRWRLWRLFLNVILYLVPVAKDTIITNPMKKSWKHWFTKIYSLLILIKKMKLVIYYNKFKTSNLVIRNNSLPRLEFCKKPTLYINLNVL